jgi:hypothetical protein
VENARSWWARWAWWRGGHNRAKRV